MSLKSIFRGTALPALLQLGLIAGLTACRPSIDLLPTLAPTFNRPTDRPTAAPTFESATPAIPTLTPTNRTLPVTVLPTASSPPNTPAFPTVAPVAVESATIPPPKVVNSNGALTITLTAAQINQALTRRYADDPLPGFRMAPYAALIDGGLQLTLNMTAAPQLIILTLTLAALPSTNGNLLDIRAVALSTLNGVTTLQVKPAQTLLTEVLTAIIQQYGASTNFDVTFVSVTSTNLTLSMVSH